MALLYEDYVQSKDFVVKPGQTYRVSFHADMKPATLTANEAIEKLKRFNWTGHGLKPKSAKISILHAHVNTLEVEGYVELQKTSAFFVVTGAMLAAVIVPSALALIGTIVKAWTVVTVVNPLLAPGPLGLPMIVWILVSAAGVLIPAVILLKRK